MAKKELVINPVKISRNNSTSALSSKPVVLQDYKSPPSEYTFLSSSEVYSLNTSQYRSQILSSEQIPEYIIFSANNGKINTIEDPSWSVISTESSVIHKNKIISGIYTDGSKKISIFDSLNRSISIVNEIIVQRGDTLATVNLTNSDYSFNPRSGIVTLKNTTQTNLLDGCVSRSRGDTILSVEYVLARPKFWWSKNDSTRTRFHWDNILQRWAPIKGSSVVSLGILDNKEYFLNPSPENYLVGEYLSSGLTQDEFSTLRLGNIPDSTSLNLNKVLVVEDNLVNTSYPFSVLIDAVVGVTSGKLVFNPTFVNLYKGDILWYSPQEFSKTSNGEVGLFSDQELFISPIPQPIENPLIKIGNRTFLFSKLFDNDTLLNSSSLQENEVGVSLSTGKLKFSSLDLDKKNYNSENFDSSYLNEFVYYEGVSLNKEPQEIKNPTVCKNSSGNSEVISKVNSLYIEDASSYFGIGYSGISHILDGTGAMPSIGTPTFRVGGNNTEYTGLVRDLGEDVFLFTKEGIISVSSVNKETDIPSKIILDQSVISLNKNLLANGSKVEIGSANRTKHSGLDLYFQQLIFTPCYYFDSLKLFSTIKQNSFTFSGGEKFDFAIDGVQYTWTSSFGTYSLQDIIDEISVVITGTGEISQSQGFLYLTGNSSVEIGENSLFGFTPISYIDDSHFWVVDSGLGFTFKLKNQESPDFSCYQYYEDVGLNLINNIPYFILNRIPVRDMIGYDYDVFFKVQRNTDSITLNNFENIIYEFRNKRLGWITGSEETNILYTPTNFLQLSKNQIIADSLSEELGGYVSISKTGSNYIDLEKDVDYKVIQDGVSGTLALIEESSVILEESNKGTFSVNTNTLTDTTKDFSSITAGSILFIPEYNEAYNIISTTTNNLVVVPDFTQGSNGFISYKIYEGKEENIYDDSILADKVLNVFNHLPEEPFVIKVFTDLGNMYLNLLDQNTNRKKIDISDALKNNRPIALKYGKEGNDVNLYRLQKYYLGGLSNSLVFSGITNIYFTENSFSLQIGADTFLCTPVLSFSPSVSSGVVEVILATGEFKFASDILNNYEGSDVYLFESFLNSVIIPSGKAEVNLEGFINVSSLDILSNQNKIVYFVERMITENQKDVAISPVSGSVSFRRPLKANQLVQMGYFVADSAGNLLLEDSQPVVVQEFLPKFIRGEVATRVSPTKYSFNPQNKTIFEASEKSVYVGIVLQNYANITTCVVSNSEINFSSSVDISEEVTISYAVLESDGGETSYTTSRNPVYRPPFYLNELQDTFYLPTDRTEDFQPNNLFVVGNAAFYISSSNYNPSTELTEIEISPPSYRSVGSRAPGNDRINFISASPISALGFWAQILNQIEIGLKNQTFIKFIGTEIPFLNSNHVLDINGHPYLIKSSRVEDNLYTVVDLLYPLIQEYPRTSSIKVSVRPIYQNFSTEIRGISPVLASEPYELFLFEGETSPGRLLARNIDYTLDTNSGNVFLKSFEFSEGMLLKARYTKNSTISPSLVNTVLIYPKFKAKYKYLTLPENTTPSFNTYPLYAKYFVYAPDTYFVNTSLLSSLKDSIEKELTEEVSQNQGFTPNFDLIANASGGSVSTYSEEVENINRDRAAREGLRETHSILNSFDQILETTYGTFIGDSDGRFKFFVGKNKNTVPFGYEDNITGKLNNRNLWIEVFKTRSDGLIFNTTVDPVVDPSTAVQGINDIISGDFINTNRFNRLVLEQKTRSKNDIDDIVLSGKTDFRYIWENGKRKPTVEGIFDNVFNFGQLSRIYPEKTSFFGSTSPGIDATDLNNGFYTYQRYNSDGELDSTNNLPIGNISNTVLGNIENVQSVSLQDRRSRARIWSYSETGYSPITNVPTIIISFVDFKDFPLIDVNTPDTSKFISQGGEIFDGNSGNLELSIPGFNPGDQLSFGSENNIFKLGNLGEIYYTPSLQYGGIFVKEVVDGCYLTFADSQGNTITNENDLIKFISNVSFEKWIPEKGTSIINVVSNTVDLSLQDPLTQQNILDLSRTLPTYRENFDYGINKKTGELLDITQPSFSDGVPYGLKELLGQNPLSPNQDFEGKVIFSNFRKNIANIPALNSLAKNDSGENSFPYLYKECYELKALRDLSSENVTNNQDSPEPGALYPNEFICVDTEINVSCLETSTNLLPVTTSGFTPNSNEQDLRPYDIIFVELNSPNISEGIQGILTTSSVTWDGLTSKIEIPRFITKSRKGDRIQYVLENAMTHLEISSPYGMYVSELGGNTTFTIDAGIGLYFNNGNAPSVGGLDNIFNPSSLPFGSNENRVILSILDPSDNTVIQQIQITGDSGLNLGKAIGPLGVVNFATTPTVDMHKITISNIGFVDPSLFGGSFPGTFGPFNFSITIDTFTQSPCGSYTGYVDEDRLTFVESFDLRKTCLSGNYKTTLDVFRVTGPQSNSIEDNKALYVNDNIPFSFDVAGQFTSATTPSGTDEIGTLKVNPFKYGNTNLSSLGNFTISAVPSSSHDINDFIFEATGRCDPSGNYRVVQIGFSDNGDIENVLPGDILIIDSAADGLGAIYPGATASNKCGTYLVRYALKPDLEVSGYKEFIFESNTSNSSGFLKINFPTVRDITPTTVKVTTLNPFNSPSIINSPTGHSFRSSGRLYFILDASKLGSTNPSDIANAVYSVGYTSVNSITNEFSITTPYYDGAGNLISYSQLISKVSVGAIVSGMVYIPVDFRNQPGLPDEEIVGDSVFSVHGFNALTYFNQNVDTASGSVKGTEVFNFGSDIQDISSILTDVVKIGQKNKFDNNVFLERNYPVYTNVPGIMDISTLSDSRWLNMHDASGTIIGDCLSCIFPGEVFSTDNGGSSGFFALAGIFLEPSFPKTIHNLLESYPRIVDFSNSLNLSDLGFRSDLTYVKFKVRRTRRFANLLSSFENNLTCLRKSYEIRRAEILSHSTTTQQYSIITCSNTQFGDLISSGVTAGSFVIIFNGSEKEELEIIAIDNNTLTLNTPGIQLVSNPVGLEIEIYLRDNIPHEQSYEELLNEITEEVLIYRDRDFNTNDGGYVLSTGSFSVDKNILRDSSISNFEVFGITEGDILIIDPQGELAISSEFGSTTIGDTSVIGRTSFVAGKPSELDDNRGYYRVLQINGDSIIVKSQNSFGGGDSNIIFEESTGYDYALYPTISGSDLTVGYEGQCDLRPTQYAVGGSFKGNSFSIAPFSYRVIKLKDKYKDKEDLVDFILFGRERIKSFIGELNNITFSGNYFVFQKEEHCSDLLKYNPNADYSDIQGLTSELPFANNNKCLSILDRRFWIKDMLLEGVYSDFENGIGLPLLEDRIDDLLVYKYKLREARNSWISKRVNQINGTLTKLLRG